MEAELRENGANKMSVMEALRRGYFRDAVFWERLKIAAVPWEKVEFEWYLHNDSSMLHVKPESSVKVDAEEALRERLLQTEITDGEKNWVVALCRTYSRIGLEWDAFAGDFGAQMFALMEFLCGYLSGHDLIERVDGTGEAGPDDVLLEDINDRLSSLYRRIGDACRNRKSDREELKVLGGVDEELVRVPTHWWFMLEGGEGNKSEGSAGRVHCRGVFRHLAYIVYALYEIHGCFLGVEIVRKREADFVHACSKCVVRSFLRTYDESSDSMGAVTAYRNAVAAVFANGSVWTEMHMFSKMETMVDKLLHNLQELDVDARLLGPDSLVEKLFVEVSSEREWRENAYRSKYGGVFVRLEGKLDEHDKWLRNWRRSRNGEWWALEWAWALPKQVPRMEEREIWQLTPSERASDVRWGLSWSDEKRTEEAAARRNAASTACAICGESADLWW
jgi:drug/metabolite transporter superfamily protein YnfA